MRSAPSTSVGCIRLCKFKENLMSLGTILLIVLVLMLIDRGHSDLAAQQGLGLWTQRRAGVGRHRRVVVDGATVTGVGMA